MAVPPTAPSAKLQELTPDIYIQHPSNDASTAGQGTDPQLVVMCGWMDARLAHLEKYSAAYRLLFPAATILILRSRQSTFYSFRSSAQALESAVRVVQQQIGPSSAQLKLPTTPPPSILVHAFSNGGCRSAMQLDEQLRRLNPDGLQAKAVIFDSCPGNTSLTIMVRAFTAPIKSRLLKIPASGLVALLYLIGGIVNLIRRKPNVIDSISSYLLTKFTRAPRLYIYSATDLLIPSHCVETHALESQARDIPVTLEEFKGTAHVAHTRGAGNEERYWGAVKRHWESVCRR